MRRSRKREWKPDFIDCVRTEETILQSELSIIRSAIKHPGEKGGAVEELVRSLLRKILPSEYGIGTGFVAYHDPACIQGSPQAPQYVPGKDRILLSGQLDVVVYDAIRGGPIVRLSSRDVFPIESVFAYVEIKASLNRSELVKCLRQTALMRAIQTKFYRFPKKGTYTHDCLGAGNSLMAIRSYIFALDSTGLPRHCMHFARTVRRLSSKTGAFISGMYVGGTGYFQSHHANTADDPEIGNIEFAQAEGALIVFKNALVRSLSRFPRIENHWSAALDTYYQPTQPDLFLTETASS